MNTVCNIYNKIIYSTVLLVMITIGIFTVFAGLISFIFTYCLTLKKKHVVHTNLYDTENIVDDNVM